MCICTFFSFLAPGFSSQRFLFCSVSQPFLDSKRPYLERRPLMSQFRLFVSSFSGKSFSYCLNVHDLPFFSASESIFSLSRFFAKSPATPLSWRATMLRLILTSGHSICCGPSFLFFVEYEENDSHDLAVVVD